MKQLRFAAWTVWFMLSWVALAHAGPIPAIIGAIGGFLASGTVLANLALTAIFTAAKIGISLLMKADQKRQVAGVQADTKFGGDNPLSFVMGDFATPGQLEYANTDGQAHDVENAYLTHVLSLGDLPMALAGLWVDDKKITLPTMTGTPSEDMGWGVEEYQSDSGSYYLWLQYEDGTQTTANSFLTTTFGSDPDRPWESDMIGLGVPLLIPTARFNQKLHNGIPQYLAETSGIAQYDPRKDSSVGGSGTQRWEPNKAGTTASTYEPSSNPVVQIYNILRGIHYKGEHIWGGRCEAWQLPLASWMAMMNVCDTLISNSDGSKEKQFRSGLEITTDQEPADVIEDILKGCNGRIAEMGGVYKVLVGAPGAAVYSFTDETIVVTEGQSLDPFPGLESTFNGAQASYPEPAEKWAAKDAPAYLRDDLEALDDDRRLVSGLQYPTVPYALQIQRLLQTAVQDARRFRVHQIVLPPEAWLLEPNDVVSWTSAWNGYEEKKFIVTEIEGDSNFLQYVTLKEVDPADYSWDADTDEQPYSVGVIGAIVPAPQAMTGWQVFPATFSSGGKDLPTIGVAFAGDQVDVRAVHVKIRLASDYSLVFDGELPYGDPETNANPKQVVLNATFLPETDYEAQGALVPFSDRDTDWSAWLPVTTPSGGYGFFPANLKDLGEDVHEFQEFTGDRAREAIDEILRLSTVMAQADLGGFSQVQQLRREAAATRGEITAEYKEVVTTAIGEVDGKLTVLGQRVETIEATIPDLATVTALDAVTVRVTATENTTSIQGTSISAIQGALTGYSGASAVANAFNTVDLRIDDTEDDIAANIDTINAIDARVDDVSASVTLRTTVEASPGGGWIRRGLRLVVDANGTLSEVADYIDVKGDLSRRVFISDETFFMDTSGNIVALFDAGTVYIARSRIRNLDADNIDVQSLTSATGFFDYLEVNTGMIAASAVTDSDDDSGSNGDLGTAYTTIAQITLSSDSGKPVLLYYSYTITAQGGSLSGKTTDVRIIRTSDSAIVASGSVTAGTNSNQSKSGSELLLHPVPGAGTYTYRIQAKGSSAAGVTQSSASGSLIAQCNRK